jgi:hypothetical protein
MSNERLERANRAAYALCQHILAQRKAVPEHATIGALQGAITNLLVDLRLLCKEQGVSFQAMVYSSLCETLDLDKGNTVDIPHAAHWQSLANYTTMDLPQWLRTPTEIRTMLEGQARVGRDLSDSLRPVAARREYSPQFEWSTGRSVRMGERSSAEIASNLERLAPGPVVHVEDTPTSPAVTNGTVGTTDIMDAMTYFTQASPWRTVFRDPTDEEQQS